MKIIIAPDSFKGTISAQGVANIMRKAVLSVSPDAEICVIPMADGGEGTVDALGAKRIPVRVTSPFMGEYTDSFYGDFNGAAVIECAACAGLPMAGERKNPLVTTTYGMGELIRAALDSGYRKLILALGGSATNDAGAGMAAALGVKFYRVESGSERAFVPTGGTLSDITRIDASGIDTRIFDCDITSMCDVTNPLYGENGAAYVFAPQKGADSEAVKLLDKGLRHISDIIERDLHIKVSDMAGGGAAGGLGAGTVAFLGGQLERGVDAVLNASEFSRHIKDCDLILTGEGRFDAQSLCGKVAAGIAARANGKSCVVIAGEVRDGEIGAAALAESGITAAFSIQRRALAFEEAVKNTEAGIFAETANVMRLFTNAKIRY